MNGAIAEVWANISRKLNKTITTMIGNNQNFFRVRNRLHISESIENIFSLPELNNFTERIHMQRIIRLQDQLKK